MTNGLVAEPSQTSRRVAIAVVAGFVFIATGTGLAELVAPGSARVVVGQEAARVAAERRAATVWNGGVARLTEDRVRERSPVRQLVNPWWTAMLYAGFDEVNERLVIGRHGWLFLRGRVDLPTHPSPRSTGLPARATAALRRRFAACGVRLVAMPVPPKATVYPDRLPEGRAGRRRLHDALLAALTKYGVPSIDLLSEFEKRPDRAVYCRTDSHWSFEGAAIAAEAAARAANVFAPAGERAHALRISGTFPDAGDLYRVLGIGDEARTSDGVRSVLSFLGRPVHELPIPAPHDETGAVVDPPPAPNAPALVCGTSYSGTYGFARYARYFSNQRLRVEARHGGGALGGLESFVTGFFSGRRGGVVPRTIVWEFPAFMAWAGQLRVAEVSALAARLPGVQLPKLAWPDGHTPRFDARGVLGPGHHTVTSRPIHTRLERGTLHHPGDGTVSIRLTGKLTGGPLEVLVGSGRDRTTAIWPPNTPEITVPLLHLGPNGPIRIAVRAPTGPALVDLATLDVVTDLDLAESVAASVTPPTAAANGWECTATLDDAPLVTPGAALVLRIQAAASALQVHLTTTDTKRPPLVATIGALSGGGTAVINLHAIEGATLSRIVVRGAGTASETGVSELRIARAKWPRER